MHAPVLHPQPCTYRYHKADTGSAYWWRPAPHAAWCRLRIPIELPAALSLSLSLSPLLLLCAAGELLHVAEPLLEKNLHPTLINKGYARVGSGNLTRGNRFQYR